MKALNAGPLELGRILARVAEGAAELIYIG